MKVKVCGNTDPKIVEQLCALEIDFIGFVFVEASKRRVTPEVVSACSVGKVRKVGVFQDMELGEVLHCVEKAELSVVQLHGEEDVHFLEALRARLKDGVEIWKAFGVDGVLGVERVSAFRGFADKFLFDACESGGPDMPSGGTGKKFSWEVLDEYREATPFLLAGGIGPDDACDVASFGSQHSMMHGVDINSKFEVEPGVKNVSLVASFVERVRS